MITERSDEVSQERTRVTHFPCPSFVSSLVLLVPRFTYSSAPRYTRHPAHIPFLLHSPGFLVLSVLSSRPNPGPLHTPPGSVPLLLPHAFGSPHSYRRGWTGAGPLHTPQHPACRRYAHTALRRASGGTGPREAVRSSFLFTSASPGLLHLVRFPSRRYATLRPSPVTSLGGRRPARCAA